MSRDRRGPPSNYDARPIQQQQLGGGRPGGSNRAHKRYAGVQRRQELAVTPATRQEPPRPPPIVFASSTGQPLVQRLTDPAVSSLDGPKEMADERQTITTAPMLTERQLAQARRRNPHWANQLGHGPEDFATSAAPNTAEYAQAVCEFQYAYGLSCDGIAGRQTHAALGGGRSETAGAAQPQAPAFDPTQMESDVLG